MNVDECRGIIKRQLLARSGSKLEFRIKAISGLISWWGLIDAEFG